MTIAAAHCDCNEIRRCRRRNQGRLAVVHAAAMFAGVFGAQA
jgi:hypothetical protein